MNNNTIKQIIQGENHAYKIDYDGKLNYLNDISDNGKSNPWREKKMANEKLSDVYEYVNKRKAERLRECGQILTFKVYDNGKKKLDHMNSCRVRLCPLCAWRRSLKAFSNSMKITDYLQEKKEYRYLFITLTVKNCKAEELSQVLNNMFTGLNRLLQLKIIKSAWKGFYRGLEITYNKNADTFHPHFHFLVAVNPSYFKSKFYISQKKLQEIWAQSLRLEYLPICNIKAVKITEEKNVSAEQKRIEMRKALAEISKYAVKDKEYIYQNDLELSVKVVKVLDEVLKDRRLIAYGGIMKEAKKKLQLEDEENGDLTHITDDILTKDEIYNIVMYSWSTGLKEFCEIKRYE